MQLPQDGVYYAEQWEPPWNRDFFQLMTHVAAAYAKQEPDRKRKNTATGKQEKRRGGEGGREGERPKSRGNGYWKKFCGQPLQADTLNTERRGRSLSWPIRRNASWLALRGWIERR